MTQQERSLWDTYDACADWCARRKLRGAIGNPLPNLLPLEILNLINADPEAFADRVRLSAYAQAMKRTNES